ncbi:FIG00469824: hypothetical protein [hydrothermal vent metagenome]|uniref:Uncharacterized protein n=1 Tax=hydrothermal vent metagenome TaxID=652676 RepID=A0A1W1D4D7_9ZZZZ
MARLISAPLSLMFDKVSTNQEGFEREYHQLNDSDDNAIHKWLKLAKARGETAETDPILLNLLVELHNKIDALEMFLKDEKPQRVFLQYNAIIDAIGFEHFEISKPLFEEQETYYGRIDMPIYPKRDIGIFFQAETKTLAKITRMHERDEQEWNAYFTSRERILIREARRKK